MDWNSWRFKNLTFLIIAFIFAFTLGSFGPFKEFILHMGLGAAFIAGLIFISTFAAPFAATVLLILAEKFSLANIAIVAALGAITADFTIFNLAKDGLASEITPIYEKFGKNHFHNVLRTKHFRWLFPVLGAILILTPVPHDVGINLMGIHKLKSYQFVMISTLVNVVGLSFIIFALSLIFKP